MNVHRHFPLVSMCALVLLIGISLHPFPVYAATYTVINLDDSGAGSLRDALDQANATLDDDIIDFDIPGAPPHTITLTTAELGIASAATAGTLTIEGAGVITVTRDAAAPAFRIFNLAVGAVVEINGLTITNGNTERGGGIFNNGTLTINDTTISGNTATGTLSSTGGGGGIHNLGILLVNNSTLSSNEAVFGGGISSQGFGTVLTIDNSLFAYNIATPAGGALFTQLGTTLTITDSRFHNNAGFSGSVLRSAAGGSISNSCITGNQIYAFLNDNGTLQATGNWWGSDWGPLIDSAPAGSGSKITAGDSIIGTGTATGNVNVGIVNIPADYGDATTAPTGNWLLTPPAGCQVCFFASSMGNARVCMLP